MDWNDERKLKLEQIFASAGQITAGVECEAYLDKACDGDDALRAEVRSMLDARDSKYLENPRGDLRALLAQIVSPPGAHAAAHPLGEQPCETIEGYTLLELIGKGGFGSVWKAVEHKPVNRTVAIKLINPGMDSRQVIARFEIERQALAMMDHPNIAKVYAAGATDAGRPYFVMELVKGVPITEHCDDKKLSARQRCELFVTVCHAVQHAHTKAIIHRDIKPSNVLVELHDNKPFPKVIDFGIAKATGARLTDKTVFTAFHQFMGTPAYASPEQAKLSPLDVDTRSDVYSLGVLLYELLTGTTPFSSRTLLRFAMAEMQRIIAEVEPNRPSIRVTEVCKYHRGLNNKPSLTQPRRSATGSRKFR